MAQRPDIFISATTSDLGSYRLVVRDTLLSLGVHPVLQDHFPPDYRTLVDVLRANILPCGAVICLVGFVYGSEPLNRPEGTPRRSYTQMEYDIARELKKPVYLFLANEKCPFDVPSSESEELRQLQNAYREELRKRSERRMYFKDKDDLLKQVGMTQFPGKTDTGAPLKPKNLPYRSLGKLFKGREPFLEQLRTKLTGQSGQSGLDAAVVATPAIHGLGGVGKTQAAVEYAWKHEAEYTALLYLSADSPENLRRNLAELAGPLVLNLAEGEAAKEEVKVAAALGWLEKHPGWFLILDNVDTEEAARAAEQLLARLQSGHVVITSRVANWSAGVEALELDVLDESAAAEFLLERTAGKRRTAASDEDDARALARDLGGLALALVQAGAYVATRHCTLVVYLQRWRDQDARVREWFDERLMQYPRSVATTWKTSMAQLEKPATALLRLLAWLAPEPFPVNFLDRDNVKKLFAEVCAGAPSSSLMGTVLTILKKLFAGAPTDEAADVEGALAGLKKYSFVQQWGPAGGREQLRVHRLVQDVTRLQVPKKVRTFWLKGALRLVNALATSDPTDVDLWPDWDPLRPHAATIIDHADKAGITEPTSRLMNGLGLLLYAKALYREAEPLLRRALAIEEKAYWLEHPNVAPYLNNLAGLLSETNRPAEAEPLHRRALAIDEKADGLEHSNVARDLNNLAALLYETNRLAEAEPLFRRALAIDEKAYGLEHPSVARDLNNLALLLRETKRLAEAEPLYRRALAIYEKAYGLEHPNVATALNNLALLLGETNRPAEAEPLYRRALAIDEKAYGLEHPSVAIDLNNLASLLRKTNRLAEAESLYCRAIRILRQFSTATGYQHPKLELYVANYRVLLTELGLSEVAIKYKIKVALADAPGA